MTTRLRKRLIIAATIIAASGCQTVDREKLSAAIPDVPKEWSDPTISTIPPTGDWIGTFGDERLRKLIDEAMLANNDILTAVSNLDAAYATAKILRADQLPSLNVGSNSSRNAIVIDPAIAAQSGGAGSLGDVRAQDLEDQFGIDVDGDGELDGLDLVTIDPETGERTLGSDGLLDSPIPNRRIWINNFTTFAQAQWEADLWQRLRDETKASKQDAEATLADFEAARLSLASAVAQGWFNLIEARQQRELSERDVTARERNLRVTERRYDRGVASSLDVRLARSALGTSRAGAALQQRLEKEAGRRLEVLLGRYPAAELKAASSLPVLSRLTSAGAPGDILARRPDLAAAEARMEAAGLRARAARKAMLPRLTLTAQLTTSGPRIEDVIDPERLAGNAAAGILAPVYQGGRLRATAKRARAQASASLYDYAQTALQAFEEAENAIAAENYLAIREEASKLAFEEAAEAERITERRYAMGTATIFDLLDAQTRRISSERTYIQSQRERVSNRVALYVAIGGDFLAANAIETLSEENEDKKTDHPRETASHLKKTSATTISANDKDTTAPLNSIAAEGASDPNIIIAQSDGRDKP
ncbi:MAG: TolC family protein [Pseudomonadota bacterium]